MKSANLRGFRVLRAIRLARLFRIFKLGRYSSGMSLMRIAVFNSMQALSVLGFFLCIGVILFSSLMYYLEKFDCPNILDMKDAGTYLKYLEECATLGTGLTKDR